MSAPPDPATAGPAPSDAPDLDVREQLVRGALALVTEEGPVDLSVRRLARAADRTTMCVYTKFTNRQGLLAAVYERAADELLAHLDPHVRDGALAVGEAYLARGTQDPGRYALLLASPLATLGVPEDVRARLVADLAALLARALEADGTPPAEAARVAPSLWAALHGLVTLHEVDPAHAGPTVSQHLALLARTAPPGRGDGG